MPIARGRRGRKGRRGRRRRYNTRYGRRTNNTTTIVRNPSIIADTTMIKLKFANFYRLTAGVAFAEHIFRGNSLYDPDQTGAGHQPTGFDEYSVFYNRYRVWASKIKVTASNVVTGNVIPYVIQIIPDISTTSYTDSRVTTTSPYAKTRVLSGHETSRSSVTFSNYITTGKLVGLTHEQIASEKDYSAIISADPVSQWYWHVYVNSIDATSTPDVYMLVEITYYAEFYDRNRLPVS